jgi:hypothetical protein
LASMLDTVQKRGAKRAKVLRGLKWMAASNAKPWVE